jgi:hypothetical protein
MGWMTRVQFPAGAIREIFLFTTMSRLAVGPTQPPIQSVPGVKKLEHKGDHSPPSRYNVKNVWSYASTPTKSPHGMMLN